jgi:hypothetical protein
MRTADPLEPEVEAALEAIDATLAGDPVDPEHAELAELALILRADRPLVGEPFAVAIDARVRDRFAGASRRGVRRWRTARPRRPARGWLVWAPAGALAAVALVVALVTLVPGGGSSSSTNSNSGSAAVASAPSGAKSPSSGVAHGSARGAVSAGSPSGSSAGGTAGSTAASAAGGTAGGAAGGTAGGTAGGARSGGSGSAGFSAASSATTGAGSTTTPPTAPTTGNRQVVQSARLALSTRPGKVDAVAQQVFDVIGSEKGYVANSSVTATGNLDSGADFQLSVPSANLQQTLIALAQLHGATVISSTNTSNDITGQVGGAGRRLAEARALLRSLLGRLANAYTTEQIDSLKAQIRDANATIDRDQAALNGLHRQVQYSRIALTIQGSEAAGHTRHRGGGGGGFTLHRAGHDAVRVLVVAAGVLLIALAVAIPLGLVAALVAWLWLRLRRHRRESALDRA